MTEAEARARVETLRRDITEHNRRYSHPRAKSRDDRYEILHLPIVILRQAKDLTYSWGSHKVHWHLRDLM